MRFTSVTTKFASSSNVTVSLFSLVNMTMPLILFYHGVIVLFRISHWGVDFSLREKS
jgi:hypothetical protein